jgi:hypothetical protein
VKFIVTSIPHSYQRYETVGDWIASRGHLRHIRVSEMGNEDYAFLIAIHEMIEAWLCLKRGVTQEAVDSFDQEFEAKRVEGNEDEPGHDPKAPYHKEHVFAEKIERMLAKELGVNWKQYDRTVVSL